MDAIAECPPLSRCCPLAFHRTATTRKLILFRVFFMPDHREHLLRHGRLVFMFHANTHTIQPFVLSVLSG